MTDLGLFKALDDAGETGLTLEALQAASGCDEYTARSLLEVAVRFDVVKKTDANYSLTDTGIFFVNDLEALQAASGCDEYTARSLLEVAVRFDVVKKTDANYSLTDTGIFFVNDLHVGINFRFTRDVCYEGLTHLTDSFKESRPAGLKVFGEWPTIYPGIQKLPPAAKKSWFEFDHHYSDEAYPKALPLVFKDGIDSITDVGGNTGKWAKCCCDWRDDIRVAVIDLPEAYPKALPLVFKDGIDSITDVGGNTGKWAKCCCDWRDDIRVAVIDLPEQCETVDKVMGSRTWAAIRVSGPSAAAIGVTTFVWR